VGLYVLGTQYNPNQSGIPWTQPGGPGTLVYPQQQINVPWANYPVPGQFFIESSGLFVAGCGHWQDFPHIIIDQNATIISLPYLKDPSGQVWQVGVTNNALIQTISVNLPITQTFILLNDSSISQTWALSALVGGNLELTAVATNPNAPNQLVVGAPDGVAYGIQVGNGDLQVAYPGGTVGIEGALVTCNMCSYIQYIMPTAQFYSTFADPITII
jgi:hypothetical protein